MSEDTTIEIKPKDPPAIKLPRILALTGAKQEVIAALQSAALSCSN